MTNTVCSAVWEKRERHSRSAGIGDHQAVRSWTAITLRDDAAAVYLIADSDGAYTWNLNRGGFLRTNGSPGRPYHGALFETQTLTDLPDNPRKAYSGEVTTVVGAYEDGDPGSIQYFRLIVPRYGHYANRDGDRYDRKPAPFGPKNTHAFQPFVVSTTSH